VLCQEAAVVSVIAADMLAGGTIDETDWKRLALAAARIAHARDYAPQRTMSKRAALVRPTRSADLPEHAARRADPGSLAVHL